MLSFWHPTTTHVSIEGGEVELKIERPTPTAPVDTFQYAAWAKSLQFYMADLKTGIDLADDHGHALDRYRLYLFRLQHHLAQLPGFGDADTPLRKLVQELDLLVHHWNSDLLRPAAASRQTPTIATRRLRTIAVLSVQVLMRVGIDEDTARARVANELRAKGYQGDKGQFGANEVKNWMSRIETGEYQGAKERIALMWETLPELTNATSEAEAIGLMKEMIARTPMPALARSQIRKKEPLA